MMAIKQGNGKLGGPSFHPTFKQTLACIGGILSTVKQGEVVVRNHFPISPPPTFFDAAIHHQRAFFSPLLIDAWNLLNSGMFVGTTTVDEWP